MGRLNVAMVRSLAKPGRYGDSRSSTLYLVIAPGRSLVPRLLNHEIYHARVESDGNERRGLECRIRKKPNDYGLNWNCLNAGERRGWLLRLDSNQQPSG